jgi:glycosyltransferase involved in cell wall biosynthesis
MVDNDNTTTSNINVNRHDKKPFVLHIITLASWGGAQRYVYDLATDQSQFIQAVATEKSGPLINKLHEEGVTTYHLPYVKRNALLPLHDLRTIFDIVKLLRQVKPDILHLHSSKIGILGSVAGRIAGVPKIIFTSHGWPYNENRPKVILFIFKIVCLIILELCDKTIAVSKAVYKTRPFGLLDKKITQIYLAIRLPKYKDKDKAREVLLRKTHFEKDNNYILIGVIGELTKNKGQKNMVYAFQKIAKKHENVRLIFIGNGDMFPELHKLTRDLKIDEKIAWVQNLTGAEIFMKAFDIVVTPSFTEALGYVPLEAGLAGVARVASKVGGLLELVEDNKNGLLVERNNPEELVTALDKLITNNELRKSLGENAVNDLTSFTNIDKMKKEIYEVYRN